MQDQASALFPALSPRSRIYVADGYGISVFVRRGRLVVQDGIGPERRERIFTRATAGIERLVLLGHTGFITLEATRWLVDVGIGLIHVGADGRVLSTSATLGVDKPALRRAQALAATNLTGLAVTRWILGEKLEGHRRVLQDLGAIEAEREILLCEQALGSADSPKQLRFIEAKAANAYWSAWAELPVRLGKAEILRVPEGWATFGRRSSPLTGQSRLAVNPANAMLNYCYALAEAETRIACLAVGLDPGVGILHADQDSRDSLALDVMEAVRPDVDAFVLDLIRTRTFRAKDFFETRQGVCRMLAPLTHHLAVGAKPWRHRAGRVAEQVARMLARAPGARFTVAAPITQDNRSRGRDGIRTNPIRPAPASASIPSACRRCGVILAERDRSICDDCMPEHQRKQHAAFSASGPTAVARLRAKGLDPMRSPEARAKVGRATAKSNRERAAWNRAHVKPAPAIFEREILPAIQSIPLRRLAEATGLSIQHCGTIRRGLRVPHARHWEAFRQFALARPQEEGASSPLGHRERGVRH